MVRHLDKDENGRTAYDRAILAGWSPITVDDLFVTEEGTGRRLLIGETADGRNPTREEISPAEEGYIRYHIQTLKRAREWEKWWNLPGLERELDAIPMAGGAIKGAIRFRDAVSVLRLRGLSLTAGWKKLRDLGLAMRITKTGRREFYDTVTGTVRAAWDAATSRGGNHWHKFAPNGKTPLNDAGRVVEKNSTAAHIPSK